MRRVLVIMCGLSCAAPGVSQAAGGPVSPIQGRALSVPGSHVAYLAIGPGPNTVVRRVRRPDGKLEASIRLPGRFGVAGVASDGSTTGLSADGRVLVLAGMAAGYDQRRTTLVLLDTGRLSAHALITLPGFDTIDAISPTGRWLYLIHYLAPTQNALRYEVRAFDLRRRQLLRRPVIDPRDRGEAMLGFAITRAMSADRRWAYTLYARPGRTPFVHALDTERGRAVCVDLPPISDQDVFSAQLALIKDGGTLRVDSGGVPVATVNTRTFVAGTSGAQSPPPPPLAPRRASASRDGAGAWLALGAALIVLLGAVVLRGRRSRRARSALA